MIKREVSLTWSRYLARQQLSRTRAGDIGRSLRTSAKVMRPVVSLYFLVFSLRPSTSLKSLRRSARNTLVVPAGVVVPGSLFMEVGNIRLDVLPLLKPIEHPAR